MTETRKKITKKKIYLKFWRKKNSSLVRLEPGWKKVDKMY